MPTGEADPFYRSKHLAEFVEEAIENAIVNAHSLSELVANPPAHVITNRSAFCDFAAGGGENVLAVRDGNRVFIARAWRNENTVQAAREFIEEFKRHKLIPAEIFGDEGGLGHNFIDSLEEAGWPIGRIKNEKPAIDNVVCQHR